MDGGEWFYLESDQQRGPVAMAELVGLLRTTLPRGTLVWRDGLADWLAAENVPELAAALVPPAPLAVPRVPPPPTAAAPARPSTLAPAAGPAATGSPSLPHGSFPRTSPAASTRPAYRPVPAPALESSDDEPPTLNPFTLWRRALRFGGRFDRGEFAMSYFGAIVFFYGVILTVAFLTAATAGRDAEGAGALLLGGVTILLVPVMFVICLGSLLRRTRDTGQSLWLVLAMVIPCINFILLVYLLAAPGAAGATASSGGASGVVIAVVALLGGVMLIGVVAAIAIPSLLRARVSANEAAAIGDIRAVISGQLAYQSMNGGYYESRVECLSDPGQCISNSTAPAVVGAATLASTKSGYVRELITSPVVRGLPPGISPSSTTSYAFVARPLKQGQTGVRSFCGDHTGRLLFDPTGGDDLLERTEGEVRCAPSLQELR